MVGSGTSVNSLRFLNIDCSFANAFQISGNHGSKYERSA